MTEPMTPDPSPLLDEIQARADAATEGMGSPAEIDSITATLARTDLPRLVAALRAVLEVAGLCRLNAERILDGQAYGTTRTPETDALRSVATEIEQAITKALEER